MLSNDLNSSKMIFELTSIDEERESKNCFNSEPQLIRMLIKQITFKRVNALFKRFNLPFVIRDIDSIIGVYNDTVKQLDLICDTVDGELVNLIITNQLNESDIEEFGSSAMLLRIDYDKYINSVILQSSNIITENMVDYIINNKCSYKLFNVLLKNLNGDEIRNNLKNKIENKEQFTEQDIIDFVLSPFMKIENSIEDFIIENISLINEIKASKEDLLFMKSMLILEIYMFSTDIDLNKIIKEYNVKYESAIKELKLFLEDLIKKWGFNNLEYLNDKSESFDPTFKIQVPNNISSNDLDKYWDNIFEEVIKFAESKNIEYILDDLSIILSR